MVSKDDKEKKFKDALDFDKVQQAKIPKHKVPPKGYDDYVSYDETTGTGTLAQSKPAELGSPAKDWDSWLTENGVDPNYFTVLDDTMKYRTWTGMDGSKMVHWSCTIVKKVRSILDDKSQKDLIKRAKAATFKAPVKVKGKASFVVLFSDWQTGKNEGGGTKNLIKRVEVGVAETIQRYKQLVKSGMEIDEIIIGCLGDIVEGCTGFYDMQEFSVELDSRAQKKVAKELMFSGIDAFARLGVPVTVISVPGNHGENRKSSKAYTTWMDNGDLEVADNIEFAMKQNPESYGHVKFIHPKHIEDDTAVTYKTHGQILGFVHGHQFRSGGGSFVPSKAQAWHKNQKYGGYHIGFADILNFGHYHHFTMIEDPVQLICAPALDGGSKWIEQTHGKLTRPGLLSYTVDKNGANNIFKAQKKSKKDL